MNKTYQFVIFVLWIFSSTVCYSQRSMVENLSTTTSHIPFSYFHYLEYKDLWYRNMYSEMMTTPDEFNTSLMPFTPNLFQSMICLYQRYFKSSRGSKHCQFTPSCSRYSYMAVGGLGNIKGLLYTFDRVWRCNSSAFDTYLHYKGYLFDPPYVPITNLTVVDNDKVISGLDTSFTVWLSKQKEWGFAYNVYLLKEFKEPSSNNRLKLAKLSLNMNTPERAVTWLRNDSSIDASFTRAIAYFRLQQFYLSANEIKVIQSEASSLNHKVASLWLSAFLYTPIKNESLFLEKALHSIEQYNGDSSLTKDYMDLISSSGTPSLSLSLSAVIPGLGQASNGFIEDGIYALLFVGGFAYLTARNLIAERYAESIVFGLGFTITYSANLYAAYNSPEHRISIRINNLQQILRHIYDPFQIIQIE